MTKISNVALSEDERALLSQGLSFRPKPSKIVRFHLLDGIKQFAMSLRRKEYFYDPDSKDDNTITLLKKKSTWTPPSNREPPLETYIKL